MPLSLHFIFSLEKRGARASAGSFASQAGLGPKQRARAWRLSCAPRIGGRKSESSIHVYYKTCSMPVYSFS